MNHGGAFILQYSLSCAIKGRRGVLKVAAATLVLRKLGSRTPLHTKAKVAHGHLGPIPLIPPKNAVRDPLEQTQESLTQTLVAAALTLNLLSAICGAEGGGEAAHLRLGYPQPSLQIIPLIPPRLNPCPQPCSPHFNLLPPLRRLLQRLLQPLPLYTVLLGRI